MSLDRDEFSAAMNRLYSGIDGINARLDVLNGRTRRSEERIAVLETRINVYAAVFSVVLTIALFIAGKFWR